MKSVSEGGTGTVETTLHTPPGGVTADWERASVWDRLRGGVCAPTPTPKTPMGAWHNKGEDCRRLLFPVISDSPVLPPSALLSHLPKQPPGMVLDF